ncbi:hypothetical protein ACP4OV_029229 [Aristida adscensionis]
MRGPARRAAALLLLAAAAALAMADTAAGGLVVLRDSIQVSGEAMLGLVTSPEKLKGKYDAAIASYGLPQYGGTLHGWVEYPYKNQKGCWSFDQFDISFRAKVGAQPNFVLLDRGDCFFTNKAWNAQNAGAAALLVADDKQEPLITMDTPEEGKEHLEKLTIPSVLISKKLGEDLKKAAERGDMVRILLDWKEFPPYPYEPVEYEFWTNSYDECGPKCDMQMNFLKSFRGTAQVLEKTGYTQFTPHYISWYCPEAFVESRQCRSQCINHGRYCAPDPEQDFSTGYYGRDVVLQNLHQLCAFKVAKRTGKPWLWWDYVHDFAIRCPMKDKKYTRECANSVAKSLGLDTEMINECVGDPEADEENPTLRAEQYAQTGNRKTGDVTISPTLVINNRHYRDKLGRILVLKAICSGFEETTEPAICSSEDVQTNECLENNGGCWQDKANNVTACKDTFRGRVCECPVVEGVKFVGDGYTHCEASGVGRWEIHNGGCWKETKNGKTISACLNEESEGCKCPAGFKDNGTQGCEGKEAPAAAAGWNFLWVIFFAVNFAGVGAYAVYKYKLKRYMDSKIHAIMAQYKIHAMVAQYMPLDNQEGANQHPVAHADNI